jgi:hypothetical protein
MWPARTALAPYDPSLLKERGFEEQLLQVGAALQTQVARDLGPFWDVSAVVAVFRALEEIPVGYSPVAIVRDRLPLNRAGFHFADGGRAGALIEYSRGWSVAASHELIEMLCDMTGFTTTPGQSLHAGQGYVDYVVEVCDPCESSSYKIDGIEVSDFVTPHYYEPAGTTAPRYSFTGRITGPLQLLGGGYITWFAQPPDEGAWQASAPKARGDEPRVVAPGKLDIVRLGDVASLFSRQSLDADPAAKTERKKQRRVKAPPYSLPKSAQRYGATLRSEFERMLGAIAPPPTPGAILKLVRGLADPTGTFRRRFAENPARELKALGIPVPAGLVGPIEELASAKRYREVAQALERGERFGFDFTQPEAVSYLAKLG